MNAKKFNNAQYRFPVAFGRIRIVHGVVYGKGGYGNRRVQLEKLVFIFAVKYHHRAGCTDRLYVAQGGMYRGVGNLGLVCIPAHVVYNIVL